MASMYEIIMSLPLFKGLSKTQISSLIEKTPISFSQFEKGAVIYNEGDPIEKLKCLIGGKVKITHRIGTQESGTCSCNEAHCNLFITETVESPAILEAQKLFGMNRHTDSVAICDEKASIMELGKEQYLKLLQSDNIYLINYLNYLSIRAQAINKTFMSFPSRSLKDILDKMVISLVSRSADSIEFHYNPDVFAKYCSMTNNELIDNLRTLQSEGLIEILHDGFRIISRSCFLRHSVN